MGAVLLTPSLLTPDSFHNFLASLRFECVT